VTVTRSEIDHAVAVLRRGGLVAFPTETVYGLAADAASADAVARLYAVKRRPPDHPVIAHVGRDDRLERYARDVPDVARTLAAACWPGPLTLVLRRRPGPIVDAVTGGRDTVGLRVPDHPVALALLEVFGGAVAAPSANRFGSVSPTTAPHVRDDLGGDVDVVLDGGPCRIGVESTIVDCTGAAPVVLRLGGVTRARLAELLGTPPEERTRGEIAAPGTLEQHYAPSARVVIAGRDELRERAVSLLAHGDRVGLLALDPPDDVPREVTVLRPPLDVEEYARVLYERLRDADAEGIDVLLVVAPPADGLGAAIADRVLRAAGSPG
jgi:L-threonylcarbamoyladenylate synthase